MNASNLSEITDVKDLRATIKKEKNKQRFKKALLFGYSVSETDHFVEAQLTSREMEKAAFSDRIQELENMLKSSDDEKQELGNTITKLAAKMEGHDREVQEKVQQLKEFSETIKKYEEVIAAYEEEARQNSQATVLSENTALKGQLAGVIDQRNEYAVQNDILVKENHYSTTKVAALEQEVEALNQRLADELESSRTQITQLSLQITKVVESSHFLNQKTVAAMRDLLQYHSESQEKIDQLTEELKETLVKSF